MSIEHTLERIATALETLAGLNQPTQTAVATAIGGTVKRGPGRPPKSATPVTTETAEPAATAPVAPPAVPTAGPVAPSAGTAAPAQAVTKEMVSNAGIALIKANLRDTLVGILAQHSADSISALAPSAYADVHAAMVAATPKA